MNYSQALESLIQEIVYYGDSAERREKVHRQALLDGVDPDEVDIIIKGRLHKAKSETADASAVENKEVTDTVVVVKKETVYDNNDVTTDLQELPEHEVICVRDSLPIDIPGIQIYLRQLVGEQQWARFVEKQGIPQILITAPEGTPDNALDVWNQRAMQIYEGGSGVLPPGANVNEMTAARGQDPFSAFCQH